VRFVGYIRVSAVGGRQGDSFISPKVQAERIEAWATAMGHEIVDVFEDLDQPGSRMDRPGLMRAMKLVETGKANGIAVAKLDRFTRSTAHLGPLLERLRTADGVLVSVGEGIDTSTSAGKLVADIMGAISEWELSRIRDNWDAAKRNAVERGIHVHQAPIGYLKDDERRLYPDPETEGIVREAFKRRIRGDGWQQIAYWMTEQLEALGGDRTWTARATANMIGNRVYLGEASASRSIVKPGAHPPLVTKEEWNAANANRGVAPARSGNASGVLSGILRCAGCRYAMKASMGKTRHGKPFMEYRCKASRAENAERCPSPASVKATVIEPFVLERFHDYVANYVVHFADERDDGMAAAIQEVRTAEAERDAALDRNLAEALGGDDSGDYIAMVRERQLRVDRAREALEKVELQRRPPEIADIALTVLWDDISLEERRQLLSSVFDCVFVRRTPSGGGKADIATRAYVCLAGEAPELPRRGTRWSVKPFDWEPVVLLGDET
jgi:site-specific DNA recombinase